ncbi:MAG: GtrA family protein [Lachnospiraceae bacterium]|nr:GtrA family protein [Lachnospiraceae bacterium]
MENKPENGEIMKEFIKKCWKLFVNRETITYIIAGVLTTLVNFVTSFLFYDCLHWDENLVTVIAWVVAVVFAYVINKYWVFLEKKDAAAKEAVKFGKFVAARLFTLAVEWLGIFIFVTNLEIAFWPVKLILAVIVTILNYVFSKVFIFISGPKKKEAE